MLKTNYTNLNLKYIVVIFIIITAITILGIVTSKYTDLRMVSFSKNTKITIEEKEFEEKVEDNLMAYTDNMSLEIKAATPGEKISSRASSIRRTSTNNYIPINQVSISRNMNLTIRTGLSREDFITLMAGVKADTSGFFEQNAGLIYDLCEIYNINEIFFCGLISAESGWNIASNHRKTNNYKNKKTGLSQTSKITKILHFIRYYGIVLMNQKNKKS